MRTVRCTYHVALLTTHLITHRVTTRSRFVFAPTHSLRFLTHYPHTTPPHPTLSPPYPTVCCVPARAHARFTAHHFHHRTTALPLRTTFACSAPLPRWFPVLRLLPTYTPVGSLPTPTLRDLRSPRFIPHYVRPDVTISRYRCILLHLLAVHTAHHTPHFTFVTIHTLPLVTFRRFVTSHYHSPTICYIPHCAPRLSTFGRYVLLTVPRCCLFTVFPFGCCSPRTFRSPTIYYVRGCLICDFGRSLRYVRSPHFTFVASRFHHVHW